MPIFSDVKKDKDMGTYEDFMECMKLYDKSENGLMIGAELFHILVSLGQFTFALIEESPSSVFFYLSLYGAGERLTEQEADDILKDCCPEENEDGEIPYSRMFSFLSRHSFTRDG